MAIQVPGWLVNMQAQLRAEKKKAAVLGSLLAVFLVVLLRQFVFGGSEDAAAMPVPEAQVASAPSPTVAPVATPVNAPAPAPGAPGVASSPAVVIAPARSRPEETVSIAGIPRSFERNPFKSKSWHRFATSLSQMAGEEAGHVSTEGQRGFWSTLKSRLTAYERSKRLESQQIDATLTGLSLRSTITGPNPMAHISGRIVRPGDHIFGFSVVKIEERRVLLVKAGQTRVLAMP